MKQLFRYFQLVLIIGLGLFYPIPAKAEELTIPYEDSIDYTSVQEAMDEIMGGETFDFRGYVLEMIQDGEGFSLKKIFTTMLDALKSQLIGDKSLLYRFISITILGAVFTNFTKVFRNSNVSEMGFYITYLILFSLACTSFYAITQVAVEALENILEFMRSLVPAYYMAIMFSSGVSTSSLFYQGTLMLIHIVELLIVNMIIPLIRIFFILSLVSNLTQEDMLSKALELLESMIQWTLKTLLGLITGYNVIQGLIVPVADNLKNRITVKVVNALPGVGDLLGSAAQTVLGAGIVIKNAIGVAGICALVIIMCIPMIRILFYAFIYKFVAALIQPISDKRIVECLSGCSKATSLLLYAMFVTGVLFLLTILIVMATTNGSV
ncbi:MAG: stage III sporulation protein AE [Velocimicrobium sp.]